MLYIGLARWFNSEESLKNSLIWIRIKSSPKPKLILPRYIPNLSTKFRPNPSTTFWDNLPSVVFGRSLNGEESLGKRLHPDPDSDHHQNLIILSGSHTQALQQISSGSVNNLLRYFVHKQTNRCGWKHNLHPPLLAWVIRWFSVA